jgi:hypothetical protein
MQRTHGAQQPRTGPLERDELWALIDLLARFTSTPEVCWFGIWEGFGWMQGYPAIPAIVEDVAHPAQSSLRVLESGRSRRLGHRPARASRSRAAHCPLHGADRGGRNLHGISD